MVNNLSKSGQKPTGTDKFVKEFSLPKNITGYLEKQDNYRQSLEQHIGKILSLKFKKMKRKKLLRLFLT